ncbi:MAG TPA: LptA/OstA family protein [Kiritimatiellia bacterium]|nr:LptA/OstA family protein [Kiritimatiellia bacterium]
MKRLTRTGVAVVGLLAAAGVFAQVPVAVGDTAAKPADTKEAAVKADGQAEPAREAVITAERIEFDNKEGVILFDENVVVDDAQFVMRSDRLLVFMEGTNDVQQIMAVGHVSITNLNRSASCDKAVYTKKDGQIVMTGNARLMRQGDEGGEVTGNRITFWLDDERMEVSPGRVVLPPGTFNKADTKKLIP